MVQLPVTSLRRCRSLVPHCIMQPKVNFTVVVLLVNSLTIWRILMVNDGFMVEENCQHHFHLALNLMCHFWSWRLQTSVVITGLLFLGCTQRLLSS